MRTSFLTIVSLLVSAVIAAPVAQPAAPIKARAAATCKEWRIFASSSTRSTLVGDSTCCCAGDVNCPVNDSVDKIMAYLTLNSSLGGTFKILDSHGNVGLGSLDDTRYDGTTYTVAGLGPCPV
ncbi:hypothetical protein K440DRAFT_662160 [Wilcoxina mikolae CBS 423.85]|nr:hypothetical protein K440DRAFT_662160 [Wilcoxina mikolae CBS 423.85]